MWIEITKDEYYPYRSFRENPTPPTSISSVTVEIDARTLKRWKRYEETFNKWQREMEDLERQHNP